jgi:glycosyltransferase involved in cell wall biosynthesis
VLGRLAHGVFHDAAKVTACSADLAARAIRLGARAADTEVVPYGVDIDRFAPDPSRRADIRRRLGVASDAPLLFAVGRFVKKKGFEYLIDAAAALATSHPSLTTVIGGDGDLAAEFPRGARTRRSRAIPRTLAHGDVAAWCAAADVSACFGRDDAGNVDGLRRARGPGQRNARGGDSGRWHRAGHHRWRERPPRRRA